MHLHNCSIRKGVVPDVPYDKAMGARSVRQLAGQVGHSLLPFVRVRLITLLSLELGADEHPCTALFRVTS